MLKQWFILSPYLTAPYQFIMKSHPPIDDTREYCELTESLFN